MTLIILTLKLILGTSVTTKMQLSIATYNLLDNSMAIPKNFDLPEEHLSLEHRVPLILTRLKKFVATKTIICLQEVGLTLAGAGLHQLFAENGYYCITSHYSTMPERDFHGVCIAFPTDTYSLMKYGEVRIGEKITLPVDVEQALVKNDVTVFEEAQKRDCRLLWVVLKDKASQKEFFVCTYHMPCCFWWVPVMYLHIDALLQQIELLAGDLPIVLAGDFNATAKDKTGEVIQFAVSDFEFTETPTPSWAPASTLKLQNASETTLPTTRTKSPGRDIFEAQLDYILTRDFLVKMMIIPEIEGLIPNNKEGSDHVPVHAKLYL